MTVILFYCVGCAAAACAFLLARYADAEAYMLDKVITLPLYKVVSWEMTHVNDYSKIYAPYGIQINKFKNWETSVDLYTTEDYAKLAAIYEANAAK